MVESPGPTGPVYKHGYHHYAHKYHGHNVYYKPPAKHRKRHGVPLSNNPHN